MNASLDRTGNGEELPSPPERAQIWFENTKSVHEHGGQGWEFGKCLWSPSRDKGGKDWYKAMREVRGGDLVIHSCDKLLRGVSFAKDAYQERLDEPPKPGQWEGMAPYYRIDVDGFIPVESPLRLDEFLKQHRDEVRKELGAIREVDGLRPPFQILDAETQRIGFAQTYLTSCTPGLYEAIRSWANANEPEPVNSSPGYSAAGKIAARRYWAISLGEGGRLWNKCQEEGVVAIGWDELGNLESYPNKDAIAEALRERRGPDDPAPHNDSLACYEFAHSINRGDYVFAKVGRSRLLGFGIVKGDYRYDASRAEYHNVRTVNWVRAANLDLPEDATVPVKTLTDVTDYQEFVVFVNENLITPQDEPARPPRTDPFPIEMAFQGLFLPRDEFEAMLAALRRKKNLILQGAPGVGKTFIARRLAYGLLGQKDHTRVATVQFHQTYAYEDFVQGYRPREGRSGFHRQDGLFVDFCDRARTDAGRPYVFVIDEINRGNLSKIFGELMMLIEADKRGSEYAIRLAYANKLDPPFSVPDNVYLLGLMNTADRSLALVDYALRRRFIFFDLAPQFDSPAFQSHLRTLGAPQEVIDQIVSRMTLLNDDVCADDANLGRGFAIGHSFFCPSVAPPDWSAWYADVIRHEIGPLLREYWFDDQDKVQQLTESLLAP